MKKALMLTLTFLLIVLSTCELPTQQSPGQLTPIARGISPTPPNYIFGPFTDDSGRVEIRIYQAATSGAHNTVAVAIASDEVLIGGGAETVTDAGGAGGLLTGTYPLMQNGVGIGWVAQSKDHAVSCIHGLVVNAIGLKLKNSQGNYLPKDTVQQYVNINSVLSQTANHPGTDAYGIYPGIIGGGAQVMNPFDGYGNLLVCSDEVGSGSWVATSKDHLVASPAQITAWCISIKTDIPTVGILEIRQKMNSIATSQYQPGVVYVYRDPGFVTVGAGAEIQYNGAGRLLTYVMVSCDDCSTSAQDKDHCVPDSGYLTASLYEMRCRFPY